MSGRQASIQNTPNMRPATQSPHQRWLALAERAALHRKLCALDGGRGAEFALVLAAQRGALGEQGLKAASSPAQSPGQAPAQDRATLRAGIAHPDLCEGHSLAGSSRPIVVRG